MNNPEFEFALILCMPITLPMEKPGSEPGLCECCGKVLVWVTPVKKELRANREKSMLVCAQCAVDLSDGKISSDELIDLEKFPKGAFFDKK